MAVRPRRLLFLPRACLVLLTVSALTFVACDDDPTEPEEQIIGDPVREFWQGTYTTGTDDHGVLVLDLLRVGRTVTGRLVFQSRTDDDIWSSVFLKGTGDERTVTLGPNRDVVNYRFDFGIQATKNDDGSLDATLSHPDVTDGEFQARTIEVGQLSVEATMELAQYASAIAYDGEHLWINSNSSYQLLSKDGQLDRTVDVFLYGDLSWTSDSLTFDGTSMWGHLPGTIYEGETRTEYSGMYEFSKDGEILSEFRLWHRTRGLAYDGDHLWSLDTFTHTLHRFDETGLALETLDPGLPQIVQLEFDGTHFWTLDWQLNKLYQIDRTGKVIRVYDLPEDEHWLWPLGIAFDGEHYWYSAGINADYNTALYKLKLEPLERAPLTGVGDSSR